jgi:hypothetical protein
VVVKLVKELEDIKKDLPVTRTKDVEFSREAADADDLEALERAEAAENRSKEK